jgi:hypothetical protein
LTPTSPNRSPGARRRGDVVEELPAVVAALEVQGNVLEVQYVLALAGRGHLAQGHGIPGFGNVGDEGVGCLDAELGLRGAGGGAAAQPGQFLFDQLLALALHHGGRPVPFSACQHVGGVTAFEGVHDPIVDFPGFVADFIKEPAVVGDHQEGALVGTPAGLQVPGQPGHTLHVQVVGGLVQHDDVVVLNQELGQGHTPLLPAGQGMHVGVPVDVGYQPAHDLADLRVPRPFVIRLVPHDRCTHRQVAVEHVALVQVPDIDVAALGDPAGIGGGTQRQQAHQSGLTVAVPAHHANPVTLLKPEGNAVQDGAGCVGDGEVFAAKKVCQRELLSAAGKYAS